MRTLILLIALLLSLGCQDQGGKLEEFSSHLKYSLAKDSHLEKNHEGDLVLKSGGGRFFITHGTHDFKIHAPDIVIVTPASDFEIHINDKFIEIITHAGQLEISSPYVMSFVPEIVKASEKIQFDRVKRAFIR